MDKSKLLNFPCLKFKQGEYELIVFSAPANVLYKHLSINRRVEDKDEGYQRTLSPARIRSIARYINRNNPIPISILISLDEGKYEFSNGNVIFKDEPDVGWVIDGQHRLAGAHESETEILLPVVAFLNLDINGQIKQFVTINKEAKGVPTSLYYDLLRHLPDKTPSEIAKERAADIAQTLRKDEESAFFSRIVTVTSPKKGELSLNIFVRKVYPLIQENKGLFGAYSQYEQTKIISNYYLGLINVFPKEHKETNSIFFQTIGFGSLIRILPTVFSICLKKYEYKGVTYEKITSFD